MSGFYIPDRALTYPDQSRWFEADTRILGMSAGGRNGIFTGCAVTESTIPGGSTEVSVGQVVIDGVLVDVAAQTVGHDIADALLDRIDLVVAYDDGTCIALTGTSDAAPLPELPDTGSVALAMVFIPAADTAIEDEQIIDKRVFVQSPIVAANWTMLSASADLTRASNATVTLDPVLSFVASANTNYRVRFGVRFLVTGTVGTLGGIQVRFLGPTSVGATGHGAMLTGTGTGAIGQAINVPITTAGTLNFTGFTVAGSSLGGASPFLLDGSIILHNGATAGTFGLGWGQTTVQANGLIRYAGSYMEYEAA